MKKFTIERSKWSRGRFMPRGMPSSGNCLWFEHGAGCCLGHYLHKVEGLPLDSLTDTGQPYMVYSIDHTTSILIGDRNLNSHFADQAIQINDSLDLTEEDREAKLKQHFATKDVEVDFVD